MSVVSIVGGYGGVTRLPPRWPIQRADSRGEERAALADEANTTMAAKFMGEAKAYLELAIGPAGDLDNHVEDGLLLVGVQGDVVEGGDGDAILLDVDAVLQGVGSGDLAQAVLGGHGCGVGDGR